MTDFRSIPTTSDAILIIFNTSEIIFKFRWRLKPYSEELG